MQARENRSDVELELELEDPTEVGDDTIFSEEEESREVVATSVERHDPMVASASGEQEAERRGDVPAPRKRATSANAVGEREVKRTWSPRPSKALPASSPPALGVAEQAKWSRERARTRTSSGLAPVRDPQRDNIPPADPVSMP